MTDIVAELRSAADYGGYDGDDDWIEGWPTDRLHEAAAEIDRLRGMLAFHMLRDLDGPAWRRP